MNEYSTQLRWLLMGVVVFSAGAVGIALRRECTATCDTSRSGDPLPFAAETDSPDGPPGPLMTAGDRTSLRGGISTNERLGISTVEDTSPPADDSNDGSDEASRDSSRDVSDSSAPFSAGTIPVRRDREAYGPGRHERHGGSSEGSSDAPLVGRTPADGTPSGLVAPTALPDASSKETPKREREYYDAFLALHQKDPAALDASARGILEEMSPDCKKVALLRALYDSGSPTALDQFAFAMNELPEQAPFSCESVPSFALRFVCDKAPADEKARAVLAGQLWGRSGALSADRRARAATALYANATAEELYRLTPYLSSERDPAVLAGAAAGLDANSGDPAWARHVRDGLPIPPPTSEPPAPSEE